MPSSWCSVSWYRPTSWIAQPESPCRRKTTSLIALGLVVVPVGDERVDDEVALRPPRLPLGVRRAERVVAVVGAHARDVADAVGAEGGDDVVGAAVVERVRVRGDRGADALDDLGVRRVVLIGPRSEAEVDDRLLRAGSR